MAKAAIGETETSASNFLGMSKNWKISFVLLSRSSSDIQMFECMSRHWRRNPNQFMHNSPISIPTMVWQDGCMPEHCPNPSTLEVAQKFNNGTLCQPKPARDLCQDLCRLKQGFGLRYMGLIYKTQREHNLSCPLPCIFCPTLIHPPISGLCSPGAMEDRMFSFHKTSPRDLTHTPGLSLCQTPLWSRKALVHFLLCV